MTERDGACAGAVCADQWSVQAIVCRIVAELQAKEYLVWIGALFGCCSLPGFARAH
jgi:hypothetical protein